MIADFRTIEHNFRQLDIEIREKQIKADVKKDEILHYIFFTKGQVHYIDQGRSLDAFWEILLSQKQHDEPYKLIEMTLSLKEGQSLKNENNTLEEMKMRLISAGDRVNKINYSLTYL